MCRTLSKQVARGSISRNHPAARLARSDARCECPGVIERRPDRRVLFDFEVDFLNEGAIQGQGFRLDIDGADISDEELAAYIVRDLRLLMVDEVRILNTRVSGF